MSTVIEPLRNYPEVLRQTPGPGVSDYARRLQERVDQVTDNLQEAVSSWPRDQILAIEAIRRDCLAPDWDGDGSLPIADAAFDEALRLLRALPVTVPLEITPGPSGEIGFEWYRGRHHSLVVTTTGTGTLVYSALLPGGERVHGEVAFQYALPNTIRYLIERTTA